MRDLTYPAVIRTALVLFKGLGLRFQMSGTEHVPREGGALLAFNHVSYVDFVLGGFAALTGRVSLESVVAAIRARFHGTSGEGNAAAAEATYAHVSELMRSRTGA